jgi:hypothetical protein
VPLKYNYIDGVTEPLSSEQHWTLYYFEEHASRCTTCQNPHRVYKAKDSLCEEGLKKAYDVAELLLRLRNDGYVYRYDKRTHQEIRIEVPRDYANCLQLLKALKKSGYDFLRESYNRNYPVKPRPPGNEPAVINLPRRHKTPGSLGRADFLSQDEIEDDLTLEGNYRLARDAPTFLLGGSSFSPSKENTERFQRKETWEDLDKSSDSASEYSNGHDSIFSAPGAASTVPSSTSGEEDNVLLEELCNLLWNEVTLQSLYFQGLCDQKLGRDKFERNLKRLFNQFGSGLQYESESREQDMAARFVRHQSGWAARAICDKVLGQ